MPLRLNCAWIQLLKFDLQILFKERKIKMIFEYKKIILKDGRFAVLKTPCIEDAEKMLNYIKKACGETDYLIRYPEEWNEVTVESEETWIKNLRFSAYSLAIACYVDDEVVGNCEINFMSSLKTLHRASVHIAIHREYWNLGIGSAMFEELIAVAKSRPEIEMIELEFLEGNDRGRALYEKFGFKIVGERPDAFKLKNGKMLKEIFMQKKLR